MTLLHAGGKFDKGTYKVSGGLHGVGVSVVNALSEKMIAEVHREGKIHRQEYEKGIATTEVRVVGETKKTGTEITFLPDKEIFNIVDFEYEIIADRLRELAYLNKNLSIKIKDKRKEEGASEIFSFKGGLSDFVKFLDEKNNPIHSKIITINKEDTEVPVDLAFRYGNTYNENILTFVNNINTIEGGTHLSGFRSALTRAMNNHAAKNNLTKKTKNEKINLTGEDFREGLTAILSIKVAEPQFEGQTKTKLGNGDVKGIVDTTVYQGTLDFLEQNPSFGRRIVEKGMVKAKLDDDILKTFKRLHFMRGQLYEKNGEKHVIPLDNQSSNSIGALVQANALIRVEPNSPSIPKGCQVSVRPLQNEIG